jgi:hypothetical protein
LKATITFRSLIRVLPAMLVPLAFGFYSVTLGQDTNWDLQNYHLYSPYAYLNDRIDLDLAPAGRQTYFNPFLDLAYFFAVAHLGPRSVGFLLGFIQGLNFILVYGISRHVLSEHRQGDTYSLLLALAGVLSAGFLSQLGTTLGDSVIALFPLLSLRMVISSVGPLDVGKRSTLVLVLGSGALAGIGCALKLVASIYALALCLSFLALPIRWPGRLKLSFIFGLSVLAGLLVGGGYWMYRIWSLFGNPLFPLFNNIFQGPLVGLDPILDTRFLPRSLAEAVLNPFLFTVNSSRIGELRYDQYNWILAYVAALVLVGSRVARFFKWGSGQGPLRPEAGFLLAFICASYVLWLGMFGVYRYLVAIELLVPLLLFVAITHFSRTRLACWGAILLAGGMTAVNLRGIQDYGHAGWAGTVYRIEPNALSEGPAPAAVYLSNQPLAWIIPALGIKAPFIQLGPTLPLPEAYWQRARALADSRDGERFLVLESDDPGVARDAKRGLLHLGLAVDDNSCSRLVAHIGTARHEYKYCKVVAEVRAR